MADSASKNPSPFDPEALLAAQRRNVEALTSAGKIVAEGMRTYAERQVSLMQDGMRNLWGEIQTRGGAAAAATPTDQPARMRAAFDRVMTQVQELSQVLLKAQSDALAVLSDAAAANAKALGGAAPDFAEMQRTVTEAMQNTSRQVTAAVEEMRQRMTDLQAETRQTGQGTANQSSAGEEDPLAGVDQDVPATSRRGRRTD